MPTDLEVEAVERAEPQGGQFALGGGRVGAKPAQQKQQRKKAAPGSVLGYNPKTGQGTGYGSKNGDARVRSLQEALNKLGLTDSNGKPLKLDGKLGPKTTSAIKKLQEQLGMTPNGRVTPLFLSKITGAESVDSLKANLRKPKPAERSAFIRALGVALLPDDHVERHLPGQHRQEDHAGVDDDLLFVPNLEFLASKRAGGHHVAVFADHDGDYGSQVEGARYVAVRMHEGGSKTWDEEALGESLIVSVDDLDKLTDGMSKAAAETNGYVDPHGKVTAEDHDNRPDDDEGPLRVSRTLLGKFTIYGYYDRYGDRGSEGSRFLTIGDVASDPDPTWDENVTVIDTRKVKFVVEGMRSVRDEAPRVVT